MIIVQMVLTIWLYTKISKARISAIKAGKAKPEDFSVVSSEPEESGIFSRAVSNQFELPVLFYVVILTGIVLKISSWLTVILAVLFLIIRIIHAREMIGESLVFKRRRLFIRSMQVFLLLLIELLVSTLFFLQL